MPVSFTETGQGLRQKRGFASMCTPIMAGISPTTSPRATSLRKISSSLPPPEQDSRHLHLNSSSGSLEPIPRSEEHTSELQSRGHLVCRLLLEKKKHTREKSYIVDK